MTALPRRTAAPTPVDSEDGVQLLARRHLRFGLYALLGFLLLGGVLEGLHAFKAGYYLAPEHEARRLAFRLAHAHGTLLSLLNVVVGLLFSSRHAPGIGAGRRASPLLLAAALLLPLGFLLGGLFVHGGDPGIGIALVPAGALCLFLGLFGLARAVTRRVSPEVTLREFASDSWEYEASFALRRKVLREPLGLGAGEAERREEASLRHLGAFAGERLVGCLILADQGDGVVRMRQVAVDFDWQRRGVGRLLVAFSEKLAEKSGFREMTLNAREHAVPFYERLGYACVGEPFIEVTIPHRRMRKGLTPGDDRQGVART